METDNEDRKSASQRWIGLRCLSIISMQSLLKLERQDTSYNSNLELVSRVFGNFANTKRMLILNILFENGPMKYNTLLKTSGFRSRSEGGKNESGKFAYHLRRLKQYGLVQSYDRKYGLTDLGAYMNILSSSITNIENREIGDMILEAVNNKNKIRAIYESLDSLRAEVNEISNSRISLEKLMEKYSAHRRFGYKVKANDIPISEEDSLLGKLKKAYSLDSEEKKFVLYVMKNGENEFDYKKTAESLNWDLKKVTQVHDSLIDKQALKKVSTYDGKGDLVYFLVTNPPRK